MDKLPKLDDTQEYNLAEALHMGAVEERALSEEDVAGCDIQSADDYPQENSKQVGK